MRPLPVVTKEEGGEFASALVRRLVSFGVGPLAQRGLDEALDLAVGLGRVGPRALMADAKPGGAPWRSDVI